MPGIRKQQVMWEELNALGIAGGGAYYTKAEFDAFFEGESENKKQVHWDRITSKPGTFPPSAHTLASHSSKAHSELTGVTSDLHHPQIHASAHEVGGGDLVHHDDLTGFEVSEHLSLPNTMANVLSSYLLNDLSDVVIGTPENADFLQYFSATSEWKNVSEPPPAAHASTHHSGGSDQVNHDSLLGFVAAEHVSLPNTIANVLSNHTKAVHDSLDIDARYIDGKEVVAVTPTDGHVLTYVQANTRWEDKAPGVPGAHASTHEDGASDPLSHDSLEHFLASEHFIQSAITTVGTIGTGVWQGTAIGWTYISKTGSNLTDLATRQHAGLTDATSDQHHNKLHSMTGVAHSAAGLTVGHVLRATAADAFGWGFLTKLGTVNTGVWQGTPIANAYVAGVDQNLLQASSPTFVALTISANNWLKTTGLNLIRDSYFGYSASYRALQLGELGTQKGIAIGIDPTTVSGGAFEGNEIALPNVVEIMQANAGLTDWIQNVLVLNDGDIGVGKVPTCKLDVNGTIKATEFYLNLGGLLDVNLGSLEEGETIRYDQGTTKWIDGWGVEYDNPRLVYKMVSDFYATTLNDPWVGAALSAGGSVGTGSVSVNHPGVVVLSSSVDSGSGYRFLTSTSCLVLGGKESSEFIFRIPEGFTGKNIRLGFQDSIGTTLPADGAYINIAGSTLTGKTRAGGVGSTTGTSYTLIVDTWYRAKIAVNSAITLVTFILYSEAGNQLWSNTLSTNIPTSVTGHGILAYRSPGTAEPIIDLDMMIATRAGTLTR